MKKIAVFLTVLVSIISAANAELLLNPSAEQGPVPSVWNPGDPWYEEIDPFYWIGLREGIDPVYGPIGGWAFWKQQGYQPPDDGVTPPAKDGRRYLLATAQLDGTWGAYYQDVEGIDAGDDITFGTWYHSELGVAAPQPYLYIDWLDFSGAVINTASLGPLNGGKPTETWTYYELRAVAPPGTTQVSFMVCAKAGVGTGGGCMFDGMTAYLTNGARHPSPANQSYVSPGTSVMLTWEKPAGTCDVYFGTNPTALTQVIDDQDVTSHNAGTLVDGTIYYWRVDTSTQRGKVWSFRYAKPSPIDILDRYLMMHVRFDTATGTQDLVTAKVGTLKDTAGTVIAGPPPLVEGIAGEAINTDYRLLVEYEDDPDFLANLGDQFTIALWAKAVNVGGIGYLFAKHRNLCLMRHNNTGYPRFDVSLKDNLGVITRAQVRADVEGLNFVDGQWWHIAVSYLDGKLTMYVNGNPLRTEDYTGAGAFTTEDWGAEENEDQDVSIGTILRPNEINRSWNGLIDDVRGYAIGFADTDISDLLDSYGLSNVCATYPVGDLNQDCYVDMIDLAIFCASWLDCTDIGGTCHYVPF